LTAEVTDLTAARDSLLEQKGALESELGQVKDTSSTEIAGLMSSRDTFSSQLNALRSSSGDRVSSLEGEVETLTGEVGLLTTERETENADAVSGFQTQLSALTTERDSVSETFNAFRSENTGKVSNLESQIVDLNGQIETLTVERDQLAKQNAES